MGEPMRTKLHSKRLADEYVRAGWRVPGDDEPYETILIWPGPGEPVYPESGASVVQRPAEPGPAPDRGGQ
jgi:hypothetical protein